MQLNGAVADGVATSFTVDSNADWLLVILLVDTTNEIVLVTALTSTTGLTVQRGVGAMAAAALLMMWCCVLLALRKVPLAPVQ